MNSLKQPKLTKKPSTFKKKIIEESQFNPAITLGFEEFYRYFMYYYPGKNKQDIANKILTPYTFWMILDTTYFTNNVSHEVEKINSIRKKSVLNKLGLYPPTKDLLEQEKFILKMRKLVSVEKNTKEIQILKSTPTTDLIILLEKDLIRHESEIDTLFKNNLKNLEMFQLQQLNIHQKLEVPKIQASPLFLYDQLEKQIIKKTVAHTEILQKEPRCDICFTRQKEIYQCSSCNFYTHQNCFPRSLEYQSMNNFKCDNCLKAIPTDVECELCPCLGGHFFELSDQKALQIEIIKGEGTLYFRTKRQRCFTKLRSFIHVSCFVLHRQLVYNTNSGLVQGFHRIDRTKQGGVCGICGSTIGLTIHCYHENCRRSFHPECAKRNNLGIIVIKTHNQSLLQIYCQRHRKLQSYEFLKEIYSNRIKQFKKLYESIDYELKRLGVYQTNHKNKKPGKFQELIKQDCCLHCEQQHDYQQKIINCIKCYGWRHEQCFPVCPYCSS